ncbi:MAG: hypothetical protein ABIV50_00865 [Opitutus sp.]
MEMAISTVRENAQNDNDENDMCYGALATRTNAGWVTLHRSAAKQDDQRFAMKRD